MLGILFVEENMIQSVLLDFVNDTAKCCVILGYTWYWLLTKCILRNTATPHRIIGVLRIANGNSSFMFRL